MPTDRFFEETKEQSVIKSSIVTKYFWAWAKVIIPSAKQYNNDIAYIDLFAGPGRYEDGAKSTPVLILEQAIENPDMRKMLVTIFNDKDNNHTRSLEEAINAIPNIDTLKHKPQVRNGEVGEEIVKFFEGMRLAPTLFFVDPWGYKGLSLRLVNSVLKDWGCDCIFFFNYNRINMGLRNPDVREHMNALFGEEHADSLREQLKGLSPQDREFTIIEELTKSIQDMGGKYVLPFCFKNDRGTRTSHHLIFCSKGFKGYEIMKEIMAKESSTADQGVPSFIYNPVDERYKRLFEFTRPLDDLKEMLLSEFSGKKLKVQDIFEQHSVDKPFLKSNYKDCLRKLEEEGKVKADPPASKRRKRNGVSTVADQVVFAFPLKRKRAEYY